MSAQTTKIIKALEEKIAGHKPSADIAERGQVTEVGDGIAFVSGLAGVGYSELIRFDSGAVGIALDLREDAVGVVLLSGARGVKEGENATRSGEVISVPVSEAMLGRVLDPLLAPIDGGDAINSDQTYPIEKVAPGVMTREPVSVPLETGILAIDSMIPVGRGQRELIIGDRQTGKTSIALDTIINQKGKDVVCIYVAIGQKASKLARIKEYLASKDALSYTTIVGASASDSSALNFIAPYSGTALAEYFMDKGQDVLVVYDDLSKHAVSYREISLLLRRPPGREAYPGDVFYLHSRLLERSCRLNKENGGGSITSLPIIETQAGDISAYIPTNVISITDGQIFLDANLFYRGQRPALDVGFSVSRVGSAAQRKSMKKTAGSLKISMAQYRELEAFSQFASDLDKETKDKLDRGKAVASMLRQPLGEPKSIARQVVSIIAAEEGVFDLKEAEEISQLEQAIWSKFETTHASKTDEIESGWSDELKVEIKNFVNEFKS